MTTGSKLKLLREKKRLSQEELAFIVGVTQTSIGNWEQGKSIKHEFLVKLVSALDCSLEYLLKENEIEEITSNKENQNQKNGFEITIKSPNLFFDDINKKMDFIINKISRSE